MIVAHHLGEQLLPMLAVAGTASVPALVVLVRERLDRIGDAVRRIDRKEQPCVPRLWSP